MIQSAHTTFAECTGVPAHRVQSSDWLATLMEMRSQQGVGGGWGGDGGACGGRGSHLCVMNVDKIFSACTFSFNLSLERDFVIVMWHCVKDRAALFKEPLGLESSPKDQELLRVGCCGLGGGISLHYFFDIIFQCC